jgi:hypothetical protein
MALPTKGLIAKQAALPNLVLGLVAAGGLYSAYSYFQSSTSSQPRKVFGGGLTGSLTLQHTEDVNHNTKRLRFAFPNAQDETGLSVVCKSSEIHILLMILHTSLTACSICFDLLMAKRESDSCHTAIYTSERPW